MFRSRLISVARRSANLPSLHVVSSLKPAPMTSRIPTTMGRITPSLITTRSYSGFPELTRDLAKERILEIFEGFDKVPEDKELLETTDISKDLGLDSLDLVDIVMALEEEFCIEIPEKDVPKIKTIGDAIDYIKSQPDST